MPEPHIFCFLKEFKMLRKDNNINMMTVRKLLKVLLMLFFISCSADKRAQSGEITIKGKIKNPAQAIVLLERIDGSTLTTVDTIVVKKDGTYFSNYKANEPGYFRLNFYGIQFVTLLLTDENIEVNVDGSARNGWFEVKGSTSMNQLSELNGLVQSFNAAVSRLDEQFQAAYAANDQAKMNELRTQFAQKQAEHNGVIKQKIRAMGKSIALIQAVNYLDMDNDFLFIDSVARIVDAGFPDYKIKQDFMNKIEQQRSVAIGSNAPEIELPDTDGNIFRLSSLRGKFVLVDFWAAWCGPCRQEMPNVVRMYQKYSGKDFEILGVSLDRKKEDWIKAIKDDGMTWHQVSDLQYFNSKAARDYNINAIPATYLIDKTGKIIGKNLRGKSLEEKLAEIFGS
jgi:peroxiredoxin